MTDEPRGPLAHAIPLPEERRLRRAVDSLNTGTRVARPTGAQHPMGERGYAAQSLGLLKALVEQIEQGLSGGPLQADVVKGRFAGFGRDMPSMLAATASQVGDLAEFARQGIVQLPLASQQMSTAAAALATAYHAFAAAAEIAVGPGSRDFREGEAVRQSEAMYQAYDLLARYVAAKRDEWDGEQAPPTD
jgi:hypothetical protein